MDSGRRRAGRNGCRDLPQDEAIQIGRNKDWVSFRAGPWAVHLRINTGGKFPDLDRHIPAPDNVMMRCRFSSADAAFLSATLPRLPSEDQHNLPVTLDFNGAITIRAKGEDQPHPTEVQLSGSQYSGEPLRLNTNREFLLRALGLGLTELCVVSPASPIVCRDQRRSYVRMLCGQPHNIQIRARFQCGLPISLHSAGDSALSSSG
jgi:hypothetical protein